MTGRPAGPLRARFSSEIDVDPFAIGSATGLLWKRGPLTLAGVGEALRIPFSRPDGFARAQEQLAALVEPEAEPDEVRASGSAVGAVAFAALPFDRRAEGELLVPQVVVADDGTSRWMVAVGVDLPAARQMVTDAASAEGAAAEATSFTVRSAVSPEHWRDEVVRPVRDRIAAGEMNKTVLAREVQVEADRPLRCRDVLMRLSRAFPTANLFAVDGLIGASPELLVARAQDRVLAHPLAGTQARSSDPDEDERLAARLRASTKDQLEHRITIEWLLDNLLPFCSFVDAEPEPTIMSLANVHHLGTWVEGRLSSPAASVLELVAALHPTPALGGDPQSSALAIIDQVEPGERGRYGGPVGWVDSAGNGEFAVAIRCGEIDGRSASIWAGVGVVADSDPQSELDETRAKFQAMLGAVIRP